MAEYLVARIRYLGIVGLEDEDQYLKYYVLNTPSKGREVLNFLAEYIKCGYTDYIDLLCGASTPRLFTIKDEDKRSVRSDMNATHQICYENVLFPEARKMFDTPEIAACGDEGTLAVLRSLHWFVDGSEAPIVNAQSSYRIWLKMRTDFLWSRARLWVQAIMAHCLLKHICEFWYNQAKQATDQPQPDTLSER